MKTNDINIRYIANDLAKNTDVFDFLYGSTYETILKSSVIEVFRKFLQTEYFSGEISITFSDVNKVAHAIWFLLNGYDDWMDDLEIIHLMEEQSIIHFYQN